MDLFPAILALRLMPDPETLSAASYLRALVPLLPMLALLAVAAGIDAKHRRIPNWLNLALLAGGIAASTYAGGFAGLGHALLGVVVGFALTFPAFVLRANGGGDVKLLAALGAWLAWDGTLAVFVIQAILGLVVVCLQAASGGKFKQLLANSWMLFMHVLNVRKLGVDHVAQTGEQVAGGNLKSIDRPLPWAVPVFFSCLAAPLFL